MTPVRALPGHRMRSALATRRSLRAQGARSANVEMTAQVGQLREHREVVILELLEQRWLR